MNYNLTLKTKPAIEPVSLAEAKEHLRVDFDDDSYITGLITGAREYCESFQNRAYITQVWEMSLDYWPEQNIIEVPKGSLQTINCVKYKNSDGFEITLLNNSDYVYSARGFLGRLTPAYGKSWPSFAPYPLDAVVIEFTCGYGDTSDKVPVKVIQAMKMLIAHWYENRVPIDSKTVSREIEFAVTALLSQDRIIPV
jgi:uncharacterized phiE125 gp8 family phage protein